MFLDKFPRRNTNKTNSGSSPPLSGSQKHLKTLITASDYARTCKELMALHRDLSQLGVGILLDMPCLTVIGSQSAGKSSLVEAVSGINVPRDSGTCTRCPMECSMSTAATSWSCTISLRISYGDDGSPLSAPVTKPFGTAITDKKLVERHLRRAQAAILSPHIPSGDFLTKTDTEMKNALKDPKTLPFSKNLVFIDVRDPDSTDLSFIDLPGLIQNSEPAEIALLENLVEAHITGENTLILVAIPMSDDLKNQAAVRLARSSDPDGERTIGVLTKPDTLSEGDVGHKKEWKAVLEGTSNPLTHGYYCVRLPDDAQRSRNISRAESQKLAAHFFDNTPPWNAIADRDRFGVPNFVANVSGLLTMLIEKNLPKLNEQVLQLIAECQAELQKLPSLESTRDPSTKVYNDITLFCKDFRSAVFGESRKSLVQYSRERYEDFKGDIFRTRPNFIHHSTPWQPRNADSPEKDLPSGPPIYVNNVKDAIAESIGWELPKHVPYDATRDYILNFTELWDEPAQLCFQDIFEKTSEFVDELIEEHFGQFDNFQKHVALITQAELDKYKTQTLRSLAEKLELEKGPPYTTNTEFFLSELDSWTRQPRYTQVPGGGPTGGFVYQEDDQDALFVMGQVRAYFQVAYMRVIDYVPLAIEHGLNQALASTLQTTLFESLVVDGDATDRMKTLLAENPSVAKNREFLEGRHTRLLEIKHRLDIFGQHSQGHARTTSHSERVGFAVGGSHVDHDN